MTHPGGRPKERFCKRGHDTHEVGRVPNNGWCRTCAQAAGRNGGSIQGKHKPRYTLAWERKRVKEWLEITRDNPMSNPNGNTARMREFETRYERLEAEVPTP